MGTGTTDASLPSTAPPNPPGLRERSKARRREQIRRTAMKLFAEHGYDATTVADIADAAEVAPRTVSGYFPTKAALATSFADDIAARVTAAFATHEGVGLLEVLEIWLDEEVAMFDHELASLAEAMYQANPAVRALSGAHVAEAVEVGDAALHAYLGLPADHPMVDICGAAVRGAIGAHLNGLIVHGPTYARGVPAMAFVRGLIDAAKAAQEKGGDPSGGARERRPRRTRSAPRRPAG